MVRKKRTDGGESSQGQAPSGGGGRGAPRPQVQQQQQPPFQQGGRGVPQGGRGWTPQQQQAGGRGGYPSGGVPAQGRGMPPQQYSQGRGIPQQQQQYPQGRGMPQQPQFGGITFGQQGTSQPRGIASAGRGGGIPGGPGGPSVPEQHQARTQHQGAAPPVGPVPQAGPSQAPPVGPVSQVPSVGPGPQAGPSQTPPVGPTSQANPSQTAAPSSASVTQQFQQLALQPQGTSQAMALASSKGMRFPPRPGKGTTGIKCMVKANHFFAELPDKDLHQYDVTITPDGTSRGVNRAVMKELIKLYRTLHLGNRLPAYDGRKSLYTAGPLPFATREFSITLLDEVDCTGCPRRQRQFRVVIKFAARADLQHLGIFLQGRQPDAPQEALQVLDIVLRELPTSRYTPVGRSFYHPNLGRIATLGEGLESWRGFYQSIRPTQMGLSLNIGLYLWRRFVGIVLID